MMVLYLFLLLAPVFASRFDRSSNRSVNSVISSSGGATIYSCAESCEQLPSCTAFIVSPALSPSFCRLYNDFPVPGSVPDGRLYIKKTSEGSTCPSGLFPLITVKAASTPTSPTSTVSTSTSYSPTSGNSTSTSRNSTQSTTTESTTNEKSTNKSTTAFSISTKTTPNSTYSSHSTETDPTTTESTQSAATFSTSTEPTATQSLSTTSTTSQSPLYPWSEWSPFEGDCSPSCGWCGNETRTRNCLAHPCSGKDFETRSCGIRQPCYFPQRTCCEPYNAAVLEGRVVCG